MALARVHHHQAGAAPRRQQQAVGFDRAPQLRDVVAQHFAEAAGLEKVALHVDDEQAAVGGLQFERIGFGWDDRKFCLHNPLRTIPMARSVRLESRLPARAWCQGDRTLL